MWSEIKLTPFLFLWGGVKVLSDNMIHPGSWGASDMLKSDMGGQRGGQRILRHSWLPPAQFFFFFNFIIIITGVEFRFGLRESKLILKFQLLHISMEKLILISGCYENHCENRFSDSRRISSPVFVVVVVVVAVVFFILFFVLFCSNPNQNYCGIAKPFPDGRLAHSEDKMRKQLGPMQKKIWVKMRETTGKCGKIEEMFLSCPPRSERVWLRPCYTTCTWLHCS